MERETTIWVKRHSIILWRGYLTVLILWGAYFTYCIYVDAEEFHQRWTRRQALIDYYELTHGDYTPEMAELDLGFVPDDYPTGKTVYDNNNKIVPTPPDVLERARKLDEKKCIIRILIHGGWPLSHCDYNVSKELRDKLRIYDTDKVWPDYHVKKIGYAVLYLFVIFGIRYWVVWMFTGQRPKSFP